MPSSWHLEKLGDRPRFAADPNGLSALGFVARMRQKRRKATKVQKATEPCPAPRVSSLRARQETAKYDKTPSLLYRSGCLAYAKPQHGKES
jgi:hypothetical protein